MPPESEPRVTSWPDHDLSEEEIDQHLEACRIAAETGKVKLTDLIGSYMVFRASSIALMASCDGKLCLFEHGTKPLKENALMVVGDKIANRVISRVSSGWLHSDRGHEMILSGLQEARNAVNDVARRIKPDQILSGIHGIQNAVNGVVEQLHKARQPKPARVAAVGGGGAAEVTS